jgi:hypothetical protein
MLELLNHLHNRAAKLGKGKNFAKELAGLSAKT